MPTTSVRRAALGVAALALSVAPAPARAQVTVTVDAAADSHPISPLIYGMNFASAAQAKAGKVALTRWGGNSTSRYNFEIDVTNTGSDYYFENIPGCWDGAQSYCASPPKDPRAQSGANAFLDEAAAGGMATLVTLPTLGWVAKAPPVYKHPFPCGCPRSALPQQDSFDPFDDGCGSGQRGGAWLDCPAATTTSVAIDAAWSGKWVGYLTGRLGPSNGRRIYALDNEPNLWSSTHHDVHPARLTYDELWQRMRDHAVAALAADPSATIAGPAEWGWPNYFCSDADDISRGCSAASPDRKAHGGEELVAWLLDQAAAHERGGGKRILHYLDLHYYPQGGSPPENTRSLWDPTYTDPSWINDVIRLIPRMRDWVAQHYPGTLLMISEYDFGHHNDATGAITYAEVLGIFGREGLDAATAWSPPGEGEAAFGAYKLYRNYDGAGGQFEAQSARATSNGRSLRAFAATGPHRATVVLVNEANAAATVNLTLAGFTVDRSAELYTGSGVAITRQPDVATANNGAVVTVPPTSFAMVVLPGQGPQQPPDMAAGPVDAAGATDGSHPVPGGDGGGATGDDLSAGGPGAVAGGCGSCGVGGAGGGSPLGAALLGALVVVALRPRRSKNRHA